MPQTTSENDSKGKGNDKDRKTFKVALKLLENYLFEIDFGDFGTFMTDEPEPLGKGDGPGPSSLLAASVANCLSASLLFAIRKFSDDPGEVHAHCEGIVSRQQGRWRITTLDVGISLGNNAANLPHLQRALDQFEDFCVVTQSVRQGIPVSIQVRDLTGKVLLNN